MPAPESARPRTLRVRGLAVSTAGLLRSAAAAAGGADAVAGLGEDVLDDATEGEDDDDDEGRDAGDEQAVLDRGCTALVHLGQSGVEHDAQVVEHGLGSLNRMLTESMCDVIHRYPISPRNVGRGPAWPRPGPSVALVDSADRQGAHARRRGPGPPR